MPQYGFEEHCWQDVVSPDVLQIYKAYQRELYIGHKAALLCIDLYNCVFPPEPMPILKAMEVNPSSCGEYAWNAIEPCEQVLKFARSQSMPVFHTTSARKGFHAPLSTTNRQNASLSSKDYEFYPRLAPVEGETVIHKERASAFFGTPLVAHLVQFHINTILVCGESTSGCVRASVVDGYSYGFHIVVVEEAVFDRSLLSHKMTLFDLHHKYADVIHSNELEYLWNQAK